MFVGNKSDLELTAERRVSIEDAREWASGQGMALHFMEVS